jgi:hypothetical protein
MLLGGSIRHLEDGFHGSNPGWQLPQVRRSPFPLPERKQIGTGFLEKIFYEVLGVGFATRRLPGQGIREIAIKDEIQTLVPIHRPLLPAVPT